MYMRKCAAVLPCFSIVTFGGGDGPLALAPLVRRVRVDAASQPSGGGANVGLGDDGLRGRAILCALAVDAPEAGAACCATDGRVGGRRGLDDCPGDEAAVARGLDSDLGAEDVEVGEDGRVQRALLIIVRVPRQRPAYVPRSAPSTCSMYHMASATRSTGTPTRPSVQVHPSRQQ